MSYARYQLFMEDFHVWREFSIFDESYFSLVSVLNLWCEFIKFYEGLSYPKQIFYFGVSSSSLNRVYHLSGEFMACEAILPSLKWACVISGASLSILMSIYHFWSELVHYNWSGFTVADTISRLWSEFFISEVSSSSLNQIYHLWGEFFVSEASSPSLERFSCVWRENIVSEVI